MKRKLISIVLITLIVALLVSCIISYANTDETIYVNLTKLDANGFGYGIGDPSSNGGGNDTTVAPTNAYIWNIATYNASGESVAQRKRGAGARHDCCENVRFISPAGIAVGGCGGQPLPSERRCGGQAGTACPYRSRSAYAARDRG